MLTRDQILASPDPKPLPFDVPEWGGRVFLRVMSGTQRDKWEGVYNNNPYDNMRALVAVYSVCDGDGKPLFTEADVPALAAKSGVPLARLWPVAMDLNKVSKADIEELAGNSAASHSDASPSA